MAKSDMDGAFRLAEDLLAAPLRECDLENGKEVCRRVLENISPSQTLEWESWKTLCVGMGVASLCLACGKNPKDFQDVTLHSLVPGCERGSWLIGDLATYRHKQIMGAELTLLHQTLERFRIARGGTNLNVSSIIWDINTLLVALE